MRVREHVTVQSHIGGAEEKASGQALRRREGGCSVEAWACWWPMNYLKVWMGERISFFSDQMNDRTKKRPCRVLSFRAVWDVCCLHDTVTSGLLVYATV